MSFVYVASPYTGTEAEMKKRYQRVTAFVGDLHRLRIPCYSPICHWHPVADIWNLPKSHEPWILQDHAMLRSAQALWILCLDNWQESKGIQAEISYFARFGKTMLFIHDWILSGYRERDRLVQLWELIK